MAARHMKDIQGRRIGEHRVGCKPQSFHIANGRHGLGIDAIGRIRQARQHLKRSGQVDLIDALEQEGANMQMGVVW